MSAYFSHTISNLILEAHGGIVLPILWIVGVQFTDTVHTYYQQYWEHYASVCFQYQIRYRMGEVCWHAIHSYRVEKTANSTEDSL